MTLSVIGRIDDCFLLSYAVDAHCAASLVPPGLELITHRGSALLNIVVCHIERMRPRFTPSAFGISYWHIAYRLQVRARLERGTWMEGLYFLRSDVNAPVLSALGNLLSDLKCHYTNVRFGVECGFWSLHVGNPGNCGSVALRAHRPATDGLALDSWFSSIEEQERFLTYSPFGLSVSGSGPHLRVVEVRRDEALWREEPISVESASWSYLETVGLNANQLLRATRVSPIDYTWRIGRVERLSPQFRLANAVSRF